MRIRIGYYIFATRLGGAESYVRDVIRGVDRSRFQPVAFLPPWAGLVRFLGVDTDPDVEVRSVNTTEPSVTLDTERSDPAFGAAPMHSGLRRLAERLRVPPSLRRMGLDLLRYKSFCSNEREIGQALTQAPVDILHVINGGHPGAVSALAAVTAGHAQVGSVVLTVCSTAMPRTFLAPIETHYDRRVAAGADAVIVPAARPADALMSRGFHAGAIRTIPWGVAAPAPVDRPSARASWGMVGEAPLVVCLANFAPGKGQAVVVEAVATMRRRFPALRVVLAGDGPTRATVKELASRLGVNDIVAFPGGIEETWALLRAADVFVLASEIEGLPLVVLEALSQATPVVATDVGGMPEAVVPGVTGELVAPKQPEALAAALEHLIADPERRLRMGLAARALYEERFTMEVMLRSHEHLYEEVLAHR